MCPARLRCCTPCMSNRVKRCASWDIWIESILKWSEAEVKSHSLFCLDLILFSFSLSFFLLFFFFFWQVVWRKNCQNAIFIWLFGCCSFFSFFFSLWTKKKKNLWISLSVGLFLFSLPLLNWETAETRSVWTRNFVGLKIALPRHFQLCLRDNGVRNFPPWDQSSAILQQLFYPSQDAEKKIQTSTSVVNTQVNSNTIMSHRAVKWNETYFGVWPWINNYPPSWFPFGSSKPGTLPHLPSLTRVHSRHVSFQSSLTVFLC